MAILYTVYTVPVTSVRAHTSTLGKPNSNYKIVSGTWDANASTEGFIVTGLTKIIACDVSIDTKSSKPTLAPNDDGTGTTSNGAIGILHTDDINGQWWAIGYE